MKDRILKLILCVTIASSLYGCSGGSGGSDSTNSDSESSHGNSSGDNSGDGTETNSDNGSEGVDTTPPTTDGPGSDTQPLSVSLKPASGSIIGPNEDIQLNFSTSIQLDNVTLSGTMGEDGVITQLDEDTLIVNPKAGWVNLSEYTLVINAGIDADNSMEEVVAFYQIDTQPPSVVNFTPGTVRLENDDIIKVLFSESMDVESLQLTGSLTEDGYTIAWSETNVRNDTLSIKPDTTWESGQDRDISIDVNDQAGNKISQYSSTFTIPLYFENFDSAKVVIGQDNFSSSDVGISAKNFSFQPSGDVSVDNEGKLYISDTSSNRVLVFNSIPTINGAPADMAVGKDGLDTLTLSDKRQELFGPSDVSFDSNNLLISQYKERLISIYDRITIGMGAIPSLTLTIGEDDISPCVSLALWISWGASIADKKILVTDAGNDRILIWNTQPDNNNTPPDLVLGQTSLVDCVLDGPSANTFNSPTDVWSDGKKLAIIDSGNNRILLWKNFPSKNFEPADVVLGQLDFTSRNKELTNKEGIEWPVNEFTFNEPSTGIWSNGIQLFVADSKNNRILIWDKWPTTNFEPADRVLGQNGFTNFTANDANQNGIGYPDEAESPTASTLNEPTGIFGYKNNLFITDSGNHRILIFKSR
ncbi:Ig-like domain-containing protein [Microbulbifer variabilis]|uniref:Ig-like domain-containing protein n=1 Tax=Microbulbifer variabilis TaxID=266805 RepID=UPI001CFCDB50|nr:Ig-like domain-containing protein [Microbulbifer variabilis]